MPSHPSCEMAGLQPGNHLCWIYRSEVEFRSFLTAFIHQSLARKERVLYILDEPSTSAPLNFLEGDGSVINTALRRGQLEIRKTAETCLRDAYFDPERMIAYLHFEEERSLRDGYCGLCVAGEMSWALRDVPGAERLSEYETRLNELLQNCRCLGLCQYDQRRFKADVLLDVLSTHPIVAIGTELFWNPYFTPFGKLHGNDPFFRPDWNARSGTS